MGVKLAPTFHPQIASRPIKTPVVQNTHHGPCSIEAVDVIGTELVLVGLKAMFPTVVVGEKLMRASPVLISIFEEGDMIATNPTSVAVAHLSRCPDTTWVLLHS